MGVGSWGEKGVEGGRGRRGLGSGWFGLSIVWVWIRRVEGVMGVSNIGVDLFRRSFVSVACAVCVSLTGGREGSG